MLQLLTTNLSVIFTATVTATDSSSNSSTQDITVNVTNDETDDEDDDDTDKEQELVQELVLELELETPAPSIYIEVAVTKRLFHQIFSYKQSSPKRRALSLLIFFFVF